MEVWITGGAWITESGYARMSEKRGVELSLGPPAIPSASEIFDVPFQRYGRFDTYTNLGCASVALTLKDAAINGLEGTSNIGMVVSTLYEVFATDIDYYRTTLDDDGLLSSPNLFSYTLPVIVLGECAVHFNLTGPTFCVGEDGRIGMNAIQNALGMISSGKTDKMIAGWIDSPPPQADFFSEREAVSGAVFVMLDANPDKILMTEKKIIYVNNGKVTHNGEEVNSITDLFI